MGSFLRSPLGVFVAILVVGFALIAAGMTAFGGTSASPYNAAKPLTLAQFKRVNAQLGRSICLQLKPIVNKKPHSLREFTGGLRRITVVFDGLGTRLAVLVPPPSRARSFFRFRNKVDRAIPAMDRANHLAQTSQWRQLVLFVRSKSWKKIFRSFGGAKGKLRCGHPSHAAA
jgi:hypothetical protein